MDTLETNPALVLPIVATADTMSYLVMVGHPMLDLEIDHIVAFSCWDKGGNQSTFSNWPTVWPSAVEWHYLCAVFNLVWRRNSILCIGDIHPAGKEGLCPDDHHGVSRVWYVFWSVPWGNRGRKPVVWEGPFCEGTEWTFWVDWDTYARERWSQTSPMEA